MYLWNETPPTRCPNNTNHLIDLNSIKIVDTVIQNSVNIIQTSGLENSNYGVESKYLTIPPSGVYEVDYSWPHPIAVLTINWIATEVHSGDILDIYVAPNTTIAVTTVDITIGDTLINVSSIITLLNIGFEIHITDGVNTMYLGRVIALDSVNNTILVENPASMNFNAGGYVQMTMHNVRDFHLIPSHINLASKSITTSLLPPNMVARVSYTNNSNVEKTFIIYLEFFY